MKRLRYEQITEANSQILLFNAEMILDYLQHTNRLYLRKKTGEIEPIDGYCAPVSVEGGALTISLGTPER